MKNTNAIPMLKTRSTPVILTFFLLLATLLQPACHREQVARKMASSVASYVYAFTSGTISKMSPIRIQFTTALVGADKIGTAVPGTVLSFSPSISGQAIWENENTIRVEPANGLKSGTTYVGTVSLKRLFRNVPEDAEEFEFDFRTRELYYDVKFNGIQTENARDLSKQTLQGYITTSDEVDDEALEKILTSTQPGAELITEWQHQLDNNRHNFTIKGILRDKSAKELKLNWDGRPIAVGIKGNKTFKIPAIGDFIVMDAQVIQEEEMYILVNFSDPLLENQDLRGLVTLSDYAGSLRFLVEGNSLRVYPSSRLNGTHILSVGAGVRNNVGTSLKDPSAWNLVFEDVKPQIKLLGRGVIMPSSDGIIFPFEAINLNYVDVEIFKIYNNNILQFLQVNELDGGYEMQRVGRIILQKRVALKDVNPNATVQNWTRYGLDLSKLISADRNALYQVRICFRPGYTNYNCKQSSNNSELNMELVEDEQNRDPQDEPESYFDNYYGYDGDYYNYNWENRENPCFSEYYNSDHFVNRNVFSSDLGIIAKKGGDGSVSVIVSDLKTTQPRPDIKVEFFDYQQQLIATATTNGEGLATVPLSRKPFVVVATSKEHKGYLPLSDGNSLSMSRFDVAGVAPQKGLKGFLYGERGVWRPGDSLYLNFVLEDKTQKLPPNHPVTFEFYDPRGALFYKTTSTRNVKNVYPFRLATADDSPTGNWRAVVKSGGAVFTQFLKIETIKPNRLKINFDLGKKELRSADKQLTGKLNIAWLHGAPARNLQTKIEVEMAALPTKFNNYRDYSFDDPGRAFNAEPQVIFDERVDDNGNAQVNADLQDVSETPGKLRVNFKLRAFEPGGDFSSDFFSMDYSPYKAYAGVSIPVTKWGDKRLDINKEGGIGFVCVDEDGKPIANRKLEVWLYRVDWHWWWDVEGNNAQYINNSNLDPVIKATLTTGSDGKASWKAKVENWGRYYVRVHDPAAGHYSGDFFYAGYPWYDDDNNNQSRNAAAMITIGANKDRYATGETVELSIPSTQDGKVLISLESGNKVVATYWTNASSGKFRFVTTPEMSPTVYANVTIIQPHNQKNNDLPIRLYGVVPINVEDPKTKLQPIIKMPDELKPEQKFAVNVSEKSGKPMAYTLAIVDEGLLDLTRFKTPNPWDHFYAREALGVQTWDVYDHVLGAYGGEIERILNIGGDGINRNPKNANKANRFKPVVIHLGPFYLESGATATHNVTLPNYIGSVRTMVVACNNGAYGNAEKATPVKKPLMLLATLPRVLGPGETLKLPVSIFTTEKKIKDVAVSVQESSGLITVNGSSNQNLKFSDVGEKLATFDLTVSQNVGIARFKVLATGGGETSDQEIEIEVRNPNPYVTDVVEGLAEAGKTWTSNFTPFGMKGTNTATLEVSAFPAIDIGNRLEWLIRYPYGCLEQTTSAAFPQLYVDKVIKLDVKGQERVTANIKAAINRLRSFQLPSGGFGYWPGDGGASHWATNYVGHFMIEAKAKGYVLPENMLDRWISYQEKTAKRWDPQLDNQDGYSMESSEMTQAYRLYTIALAKKADMGSMNRMKERKNLSIQAKWRLAAAYAVAGKTEIAKEMVKGASVAVTPYREMGFTYGSDLRDQAMILETQMILGDKLAGAQLARQIAKTLSSGSWYSTQSVAYALKAVCLFVGNNETSNKFSFTYQLDGGQTVTANSTAPVMQIDIPVTSTTRRSISVNNTGSGLIYARVILNGQPLVDDQTAASSHLNMSVAYKNMKGEALNPTSLSQGTDFIAEVTITNPGSLGTSYQEMALRQIFPSGWEIHNARMDGITGYTATTSIPEYQDIRDDRVYTFFDVAKNNKVVYRIQLNAAYAGRYYLPSVSCEAMYDNNVRARQPGMWVVVSPTKGKEG
jgi:uncharacterized protein YfaS (alpha-2-macroglobulin family)